MRPGRSPGGVTRSAAGAVRAISGSEKLTDDARFGQPAEREHHAGREDDGTAADPVIGERELAHQLGPVTLLHTCSLRESATGREAMAEAVDEPDRAEHGE